MKSFKKWKIKGLAAAFVAVAAIPGVTFAATDVAGASTIYLEQNWDQKMRELYYYTPQGSRLMPYNWFLALEQENSQAKFSSPENLSRFGIIYDAASSFSHDGLPIGFTKDPKVQEGTGQWLGLNCAACHTNDVHVRGKTVRIDGAPSLADYGAFFTSLSNAVKATRLSQQTDPAKFTRFATAVLGHTPSADEANALAAAYQSFSLEMEGRMTMRTPPLHAGAGRIDALGQIINALSVFDLQEPDNLRSPSAPVSYPYMWVAPHLDFVQYVPVASSPISRNAGEVLGVFGDTSFTDPDQTKRLKSSVLLENLAGLEDWIATLQPPPWSADMLGKINHKKAEAGKVLFDKDCRSCHHMPPYDKDGELTKASDNMKGLQFITTNGTNFLEIGTDTTYSTNLLTRTAKTGSLSSIFNNAPIVEGAMLFLGSVSGVVEQAFIDQFPDADVRKAKQLEYAGYRFKPDGTTASPSPDLKVAPYTIKAGPLLGIWATGPFLHNGAVPNIYDLLSPPEKRAKKFWVGGRELDTGKLGFVSSKPKQISDETSGLFLFDTTLPGNSNAGHVYPKTGVYTHEEKMAIIEYLKDPMSLLPTEQRQAWPGASITTTAYQ